MRAALVRRMPGVAALAAALAFGTLGAIALPPGAVAADLIEIQRLARENDPQFAAARAGWIASRERLPQARSGLLPSLSLSGSANRNDTNATLLGAGNPFFQPGGRRFDTTSLNLQVIQPVFRPATRVQYDQAGIQLEQADLQLLLASQDLTLRAAQAFFDVLSAQEALAVVESQKRAIGEQLAQAKANFEVGTATIVDYNEAKARFDLASSQEIAGRNDLEVRRQALQQVTGRLPPTDLRPLRDTAVLAPPAPHDIEQWSGQARDNALTVRIQQASVELARREIDRQRAGHLPTLDAVGSAGNSRAGASPTSSIGTDVTQVVLGLQLSVPLYQGGAIDSRVREAVANRERALLDVETARRAAVLAARQAYLGVTSGISQVNALQAAMESAGIALESTQLGLKVGVRTQVDVLNAQQAFFNARRDLVLARYSTLLSGLRLQAAVGDLQDDDLQPINALLR
ncbi:MAG: TolC family outer membrane protein [Rhodocyclaceae bacterium]|nr:TolC family outer membrane protein [Rhodocyclaceae bacterium]